MLNKMYENYSHDYKLMFGGALCKHWPMSHDSDVQKCGSDVII